MKNNKFARCAIAILFVCSLCFGLISCEAGKNEEYETVNLTAYNYSEYISLKLNFESFDADLKEENTIGRDTYHIVCAGSINSSRNGNFQFENVLLVVDLSLGKGWVPRTMTELEFGIDYDGNGKYSFYIENDTDLLAVRQFTSADCEIKVTKATGIVRVYK